MEQADIKFSAAVTTNQCQDEYSKDFTHKLKFKFKLRCSYCSAQLHNSMAPKSYWRYVNAVLLVQVCRGSAKQRIMLYISVSGYILHGVGQLYM